MLGWGLLGRVNCHNRVFGVRIARVPWQPISGYSLGRMGWFSLTTGCGDAGISAGQQNLAFSVISKAIQ